MTPSQFLFLLTCLFWGEIAHVTAVDLSVHQNSGFITATTGDKLTLECSSVSNVATRFYWYKQHIGEKLRLISSFYKFDKVGVFHDEFKTDSRLSLFTDDGRFDFTIRDLNISDSATYFCANSYSYKFEFGHGVTIDVTGSDLNIPAVVHHSVSGNNHQSLVPLNCKVHIGTSDKKYSVYWFKDSGESKPGIIYTHGERNNQSDRKEETQTQTCVYTLPEKNLTHSHTRTYYCAVASCGHILLRNTTKQKLEDKDPSPLLIHFLSGALTFTIILSLLLIMCIIIKRKSCQCTDSHSKVPNPSTTNEESERNEENIHYAALRQPRTKRPERQKNNSQAECVYSGIKQ